MVFLGKVFFVVVWYILFDGIVFSNLLILFCWFLGLNFCCCFFVLKVVIWLGFWIICWYFWIVLLLVRVEFFRDFIFFVIVCIDCLSWKIMVFRWLRCILDEVWFVGRLLFFWGVGNDIGILSSDNLFFCIYCWIVFMGSWILVVKFFFEIFFVLCSLIILVVFFFLIFFNVCNFWVLVV